MQALKFVHMYLRRCGVWGANPRDSALEWGAAQGSAGASQGPVWVGEVLRGAKSTSLS